MDEIDAMSRLLELGGTMLAEHCRRCGAPLFRYRGNVGCPICDFKMVEPEQGEVSREREDKEEKGEGYIKRERSYGRYYRAIPLPVEIDKELVNATFEAGVLSIEMPKMEGKDVKKIEIK